MKDLNKYIENDAEFAREIISSFIDNLIEFRTSLLTAIRQKDASIFLKSCHKMKLTVEFTQNEKLQQQTDMLHTKLQNNDVSAIDIRTQNLFCRLCTSSITELEKRLENYKIPLI